MRPSSDHPSYLPAVSYRWLLLERRGLHAALLPQTSKMWRPSGRDGSCTVARYLWYTFRHVRYEASADPSLASCGGKEDSRGEHPQKLETSTGGRDNIALKGSRQASV